MDTGAHIILGTPDEALKQAAQSLGLGLHEYESDKELMLLRMPAIVEGALQLAIENTDRTLHRSKICVVGYGNIGAMLTRTSSCWGQTSPSRPEKRRPGRTPSMPEPKRPTPMSWNRWPLKLTSSFPPCRRES